MSPLSTSKRCFRFTIEDITQIYYIIFVSKISLVRIYNTKINTKTFTLLYYYNCSMK